MTGVVHVIGGRDTQRSRHLAQAGQGDPATVVITASGRQPTLLSLSREVLIALGKDFDLDPNRKGSDTGRWRDAQAWLQTRQVDDLIVCEAQRMSLATLNDLLTFAHDVVARLWLVEYEPVSHRIEVALAGVAHATMPMNEFEQRWTRPLRRSVNATDEPDQPDFPAVPRAIGLIFRDTCRRLLAEDAFVVVDKLHAETFAAAHFATSDSNRRQHPQRLAWVFRSAFVRLADPDAVVTAARAIEAAAFLNSWNVTIDEFRLRNAALSVPRTATFSPNDWATLHKYPRPDAPAICTLLASGIPHPMLSTITLNRVASDGATVEGRTPNGAPAEAQINPKGRGFIIAQVARRRLCGATGTDLLIEESPTSSGKRSRITAARVARDGGVGAVEPGRAPVNPVRWASNKGFRVRALKSRRRPERSAVTT